MIDKSKNRIQLYPLGKYKDFIRKELAHDEDIQAIMLGENNDETASYDPYDILMGDSTLKLEGQIRDVLYLDETQLKTKVYILMDTFVDEVVNDKIKLITIKMNVFAHNSLMKLSETEAIKYYNQGHYGNRIDILLDMVCRKLNGSLEFGIGQLELKPRVPISVIQPTTQHYGKSILFSAYEF